MNFSNQNNISLKEILKTHFGFREFLPGQESIIQNVLAKKDGIAIMPTGGGKSLCYQLPALTFSGTTIVISPLIALMKDQVDSLKSNGINAAYLNSSLTQNQQQNIFKKLKENRLKLIYIAPESLFMLSAIKDLVKISLIAIDEAHCISAWGHDFRPAYQKLSILKDNYPKVPIIALTATADKATREDIARQLNIPEAKTFITSFDRPNLYLEARPGQKRKQQIFRFLKNKTDQSGIIYCLSRKSTESLADDLQRKGFSAQAYHAGMSSEKRNKVQENFINDNTNIVVATIAFGMGIDKSNVRFVVHYNMPKNIEGYYQEIGRAGRDGLPAQTLLFYSYGDVSLLRNFAEESANREFQLAKLERMQQYAESFNCRRRMLLSYFGEHLEKNCGHCDNCKNPPRYFNGTIIAQKICSAIARTKEQVSINLLVNILRGSQNAEIYEHDYQKIKTFGAAKNISFEQLKNYVIQLINQGILEIWFHQNGRLILTSQAKKVLFKGLKVQLAKQDSTKRKTNKITEIITSHGELFELLREKRNLLSRIAKVPPYIILGDASLEDMENRVPTNLEEFADIFGVGKAKLDQYASDFLSVIKKYIEANKSKFEHHQFTFGVSQTRQDFTSKKKQKSLFDKLQDTRYKIAEQKEINQNQICSDQILKTLDQLKPRDNSTFKAIENAPTQYIDEFLKTINRHCDQKENKIPSDEYSYQLYTENNIKISEIAKRRGLAEETIMGHLIKMHAKGFQLDLNNFIDKQEIESINQAKETLKNPDTLRPYHDYFEGQLPYWKIRLGLDIINKDA